MKGKLRGTPTSKDHYSRTPRDPCLLCEKGWKWVKLGKNPKVPYPQCGRSIKTYARHNNDAPSISNYPPPLRKHPESHQNDGNTGSRA